MKIQIDDIISFFDSLADSWDAHMIRNEEVISSILDHAGIRAGIEVLDVACGTGVLISDYLKRGVNSVTAIDISPKMAAIADRKYQRDPRVRVICADATQFAFGRLFDSIIVYNAAPHFADLGGLITVLAAFLKPEGRLTIAHGMSRAAVNRHHGNVASTLKKELPAAEELAAVMNKTLAVEAVISDDRMYLVTGIRKEE